MAFFSLMSISFMRSQSIHEKFPKKIFSLITHLSDLGDSISQNLHIHWLKLLKIMDAKVIFPLIRLFLALGIAVLQAITLPVSSLILNWMFVFNKRSVCYRSLWSMPTIGSSSVTKLCSWLDCVTSFKHFWTF